MGLAGVAIRAGARSAFGSFCAISDAAAYRVVVQFDEQLMDPAVSKAEVLRRAQLALLDSRAYQHPFSGSPSLLVSSWM